MTRDQAMKMAEEQIMAVIRSGNAEVYEAARGADGRIDKIKLTLAAVRATEKLADILMSENVGAA
jgi:hypothetical protein